MKEGREMTEILFNKNIHVDTQKMINTLRESQPDQTIRMFLKIIIETTQYQLEQLVEYLTHNGFLIS